jgi:type IV secretion system protein VirB11
MNATLAEVGVGGAFLRTYLAPLQGLLDRADVTDIFVNRPGEAWVETVGGAFERHSLADLNEVNLRRLAQQIAAQAHQGVSREHPLLSATLPGGARVQVVAPPATRAHMVLALRKHVLADLALDDIAVAPRVTRHRDGPSERQVQDKHLAAVLDRGEISRFLAEAVRLRRNIVVSGGTATGKTTVTNALIKEIPRHERLILIEDAQEIQLDHPNAAGLLCVRGDLGESRVTSEELLEACLRLRPDRIILGELRGREAFSFLRAANSGHPGSITTLHADSPARAARQLGLMVAQAGLALTSEDIAAYIDEIVDVWLQLSRIGGRRMISEIAFKPRD